MTYKEFPGLNALCADSKHVIVTAHRGLSGCFPENTTLAMRKAIQCGADILEFDLRVSRDGVPVLLHDATLNRTSDLNGRPEELNLEELRCGNFSHYLFGTEASAGKRYDTPVYRTMTIPTFEEILQEFRGQAGMNIQVYTDNDALTEICRLYQAYQMYDHGYLTLARLEDCEQVKQIDKRIEICFTPAWSERGTEEGLRLCKQIGCRFVQPVAKHSGPESYRLCQELGLRANVFYADTDIDNRNLLRQGANGILSNRPDIVIETLQADNLQQCCC